jgi:hypothetical protein
MSCTQLDIRYRLPVERHSYDTVRSFPTSEALLQAYASGTQLFAADQELP